MLHSVAVLMKRVLRSERGEQEMKRSQAGEQVGSILGTAAEISSTVTKGWVQSCEIGPGYC